MAGATLTDLTTRVADTDTAITLGGVVIVGAGLSISSRFPATRGLTSLLWDALDTDVVARSTLAVALGRDDTEAKYLVGDMWTDVEQAWAAVAGSTPGRGSTKTTSRVTTWSSSPTLNGWLTWPRTGWSDRLSCHPRTSGSSAI